MTRSHRILLGAGFLALALAATPAAAAERVIFLGGHSILVQSTETKGEMVTLNLLEGGTITLPRTAIQSMEPLDREEAMEEWKRSRKGNTVASSDSPGRSEPLDWATKMRLLESGPPPADTGTEPETAMLNRRGYSIPVPGRTTNVAPYGVNSPTDLSPVSPSRTRDITTMPLATAPGKSGSGQRFQGPVADPRIRQFYARGGEPPSGRAKAHDRSSYGAQ